MANISTTSLKIKSNKDYVHQLLEDSRTRKARKEALEKELYDKQLLELQQKKQEKLKANVLTQPTATHFSRRNETSKREVENSPPVKQNAERANTRTKHTLDTQQISYQQELQNRIEEKADNYLKLADGNARRDLNISYSPPTKQKYSKPFDDDFDPYATRVTAVDVVPARTFDKLIHNNSSEDKLKEIDEQEKLVYNEITKLDAVLEANNTSPQKQTDIEPRKRPTTFVKPLDMQRLTLASSTERQKASQKDDITESYDKRKMVVRSTITSRRRCQSASRVRLKQQAEKDLEEKRLFKPRINHSVIGSFTTTPINTHRSRASSAGNATHRSMLSRSTIGSSTHRSTSSHSSKAVSNTSRAEKSVYDPEEEMGPTVKATFVQLKHLMIRDEEFKRVMNDIKIAEKNISDLYERNLEQSKIQRHQTKPILSTLNESRTSKINHGPNSVETRKSGTRTATTAGVTVPQLDIKEPDQIEDTFTSAGSSHNIKHAMALKLEQLQESLNNLSMNSDQDTRRKTVEDVGHTEHKSEERIYSPHIRTTINPSGNEDNTLAITTYITTPPNMSLDRIRQVRSTTRVVQNNDDVHSAPERVDDSHEPKHYANPLLKIINCNNTSNTKRSDISSDTRQYERNSPTVKSFVSTALQQLEPTDSDIHISDVSLSPSSVNTLHLFKQHMHRKHQQMSPQKQVESDDEFLKKFEYFENKLKHKV
jgi:hypothetical protein